MLSESFGAGFNGPLMVTIDTRGADDAKAAADTVGKEITGLGEAAAVTPANFNEAGDTAPSSRSCPRRGRARRTPSRW